ncbi:MAG: hypothetical protein QM759_07205 [Terricaulis sp.]
MSAPEVLYDTGPPADAPQAGLRARVKGALTDLVMPALKRGARGYVGGESVSDAIAVAARLASDGTPTTLGYWPASSHESAEVAGIYLAALREVAAAGLDSYVSIKPPALRFEDGAAAALAKAAAKHDLRLHCDSHGCDVADLSHGFAETLLQTLPPARVGVTLPGRWVRSVADADWACARGVMVRVVKGQWPDPDAPARDLTEGYLEVVGRLAGRARHVAVATHDTALAQKAVALLRAANTPCELEMILGMPVAPLLRWAKANGVAARIYVPFGPGYIPNALGILRRNPQLAWRVACGMFSGAAAR